jgi:hypothetical protein
MRKIPIKGAALAVPAMLILASGAEAQSIRGSIGSQSRAEVRISVNVMPRFKLQEKSRQHAAKADGKALSISTNAPNLRYALVAQPAAANRSHAANEPLLVLVVPD